MSQGILQGKITKYANNPDKLKQLMEGRPESVKVLARSHLRTVLSLMAKNTHTKKPTQGGF